MDKKELEKKFNIGIPCYNNVFFELQPFTLRCYRAGLGCEAINAERNLRRSGVKLIRENTSLYIQNNLDENIFSFLTMGVDIKNSNASFGFNRVSKLRSLLKRDYSEFNTDEQIRSLKLAKNILINYDFSDLEDEYYYYLDQDKVEIKILEEYCRKILELVKLKSFDLAQSYMFFISAYYKKYGNISIWLNDESVKLKYFIDCLKNKLNLKDEYLLREGFIDKDFNYNLNIIKSIKEKEDVLVDNELCESSYDDVDRQNIGSSHGKTKIITDPEEIERVLNDRRMFYLSHNPLVEIRSDGTFAKYGAFLYENGHILADRLYGINTLSGLKQDAIYKFTAEDFEVKRYMTKSELTNIPESKFYHSSKWKDRASKYITMETSDELKEKAKQLIKK